MICELLNRSPGHFSSGICVCIMLMTRDEQLFAQMWCASLRMSRALRRLWTTWSAENSKRRLLMHANIVAVAAIAKLLQGRSVESAELAPGHGGDRWTGRARVSAGCQSEWNDVWNKQTMHATKPLNSEYSGYYTEQHRCCICFSCIQYNSQHHVKVTKTFIGL